MKIWVLIRADGGTLGQPLTMAAVADAIETLNNCGGAHRRSSRRLSRWLIVPPAFAFHLRRILELRRGAECDELLEGLSRDDDSAAYSYRRDLASFAPLIGAVDRDAQALGGLFDCYGFA